MENVVFQKNKPGSPEPDIQREEFETYFRLYYNDLCKYAFSYTNDKELSKDIVQSVFLKVWEQKDLWNDWENAKPYLYKSVRNEALNYQKHEKVKRKSRSEIQKRIREWKEIYQQEETREFKVEIIREGIRQLPDRCREIFKLSRESGLTYKEISELLGLSIKTIETQMGRAFRTLRSHAKEHWSQVVLLFTFLVSG